MPKQIELEHRRFTSGQIATPIELFAVDSIDGCACAAIPLDDGIMVEPAREEQARGPARRKVLRISCRHTPRHAKRRGIHRRSDTASMSFSRIPR